MGVRLRDTEYRLLVTEYRSLIRRGGLPALKATMQLVGVDCGPVRLPLRALSASAVDELRRQLEEIGFFDWGRG